uniref:Carbonic anhydrase n=1 Tax=Meloidogyne incognita TaxID=6306 RepID=A0A914L723_MELIC
MSTQIIEHQEELLIKDKTEDIISCKNQIPLNAKNVEINAVNTTQIVVPDSSTDKASEKTNEKIIEKISNNQQKQEIQKPLTVQDWDYDDLGPCGPNNWLKIIGDDKLGKLQSPINLQLSQMRILSLTHPLCLVNYRKPLPGQFVNTGCSIQFLPDPQVEPPEIYGGNLDQNYRFVQYHFHWAQNDNEGSEHCIGGLRYPAELHLVHKGVEDENKLAVLGIFIKLDDAKNDDGKVKKRYIFEKQEMEALKELTEFGNKKALDSNHCLELKLPPNCCVERENFKGAETFTSSFVRYQGSLTTPPCTENVHWTIFTDPVFITKEQLSYLRKIKDCRGNVILKNYRPVQNLVDHQVCLHLAS